MSYPNRIREHRTARGLSLAALAERTGTTAQQLGRLEKGERRLTTDWIHKLAAAMDVPAEDILGHAGGERVIIPEISLHTNAGAKPSGSTKTPMAVREQETVLSEWALPRQLLANHVGTDSTMRIIQVMGDSMQPDFNPGDRVMVNTADRMPSPPGVFVLWDGFGLIIKRCEMVPHSNPARVILSSANAQYATYEMDIGALEIQGRVIGKWQWT